MPRKPKPSPHPMQPIVLDENRVARFKTNAIVQYLLDAGPFDMNALCHMSFTQEDREQFAQLIGYSVSGYNELSYVREESTIAANRELDAMLRQLDKAK